ncbi:hypothetical protein Tco_0594019 [Tanacetum coccineum]
MGDVNPIRTLGDYSKPSNEGYRNTIELPEGNNVVPLRSDTIPLENLSQKYGLVLRTYSKKSLIMASNFGSKSKSFMTMSLPPQDEPLNNRPVQDVMISKINLLWKTISENLDDTPNRNTAGSPTTQMNFTSTNYPTKEEFQGKGIKSPSKLLSPKYLSQSSLAEQNRNPSSPKRVHFVNSIVILNKEDEAKEEGIVKSRTTEYKVHEMKVVSKEEFEEETKEEIEKEEEEDSLEHFDTFPTIKELRLYYNWIMSKRLVPRRKPSNPKKICNFVGMVKRLKVFVWNVTYKCDFVVLKDTTSIIDHDLGSVVFRKPFVEATGLIYERKEGTITFEKDKDKIVFKMSHKLEMFKHIDFTDIKTDRIPPFVIESNDDNSEKTHYSNSFDLGPEYKHDENVCRAIRSLIAMKAKRNKEEVMFHAVIHTGNVGIKRLLDDLRVTATKY